MLKLPLAYHRAVSYTLGLSYIIHYFLNFTSNSLVSYSFFLIAALTLIAIMLFDVSEVVIVILCFVFIEGQGRVLSGYNFFFRIAFDLFNTFLLLRLILKNKKLIDVSQVPRMMILFFVLHSFWFFISLFNPTGVAPIYAFAAVKYYMLPIILFFSMLSINEFSDIKYLKKLGLIVFLFTMVNCLLCIYQLYTGEQALIQMSSHYASLFKKYEYFQGKFFRPWGTSHEVGGTSVVLTCTVGFLVLYFRKESKLWKKLFFIIVLILSWITLFICQIRSQFIKHSLILLGIAVVLYFIASKSRLKAVLVAGFLVVSFPIVMLFMPKMDFLEDSERLDHAAKRYSNLLDTDITKKRPSPSVAFERIATQGNLPFGYGPGMVSNFLPQIAERRKNLIWLKQHYLWSGDNLIVFTFLELGIGAFFYLPLFLMGPFVILQRIIKMDRDKNRDSYQVALIALVVLTVMILGNWAYVGLPFNPESFFFWIWTVIGWKASTRNELNVSASA